MDDTPGWMVFVMIGAVLLNWLCRFAGLLVLLWFGCNAVADGYMAGDWVAFVRDTAVATVGWVLLHDVKIRFNIETR